MTPYRFTFETDQQYQQRIQTLNPETEMPQLSQTAPPTDSSIGGIFEMTWLIITVGLALIVVTLLTLHRRRSKHLASQTHVSPDDSQPAQSELQSADR